MSFEDKQPEMKTMIDNMALKMYGITTTDAIRQGICVNCKKNILTELEMSEADKREWLISALCNECFPSEED